MNSHGANVFEIAKKEGIKIEDIRDFSSNINPLGPSKKALESLKYNLNLLSTYPDVDYLDLREAISTYASCKRENIVLGLGSTEILRDTIYYFAPKTAMILSPCYSEYERELRKISSNIIEYNLEEKNDFKINLDQLINTINEKNIDFLIFANPNNPTGTTVTREAFAEFMAQVPGDVVVALDEAYIELVDEVTHAATPLAHELLDTYPNLVGLRTFSKVYGLAGLRVGYMFGPEKLVEAVNKVAIPFSVNTLAQIAALTSLDAQEELTARIAEVRAQRVAVTEAINAATGRETVLPNSQANFIWIGEDRIADLSLLDDVSVATTTDLGDFLAQRNILIRCFASEGARITITTEEETSKLLAALGIEH